MLHRVNAYTEKYPPTNENAIGPITIRNARAYTSTISKIKVA